jgi:hypothetical protein
LACLLLLQICTQDQLVALIHEGGLTNKLKGCTSPRASFPSPYGPDAVLFKLTEVWTQKARGLSREIYKKIEGGQPLWVPLAPVLPPARFRSLLSANHS